MWTGRGYGWLNAMPDGPEKVGIQTCRHRSETRLRGVSPSPDGPWLLFQLLASCKTGFCVECIYRWNRIKDRRSVVERGATDKVRPSNGGAVLSVVISSRTTHSLIRWPGWRERSSSSG